MPQKPQAVAFDVIETLFSLEPLRERLTALSLPENSLELWFGRTLRDAFALAATDSYAPFEAVAAGALAGLLADNGKPSDLITVKGVLGGMSSLPAHPDVAEAFSILRQAGVPIIALSNGSREQTRGLLQKAGLEGDVAHILSTDEVKLFKPRREVYEHAARTAQVAPERLALVAAHGWDVHGARRAGLVAGWVKRREVKPSSALEGPNIGGQTLDQVVCGLLELPGA